MSGSKFNGFVGAYYAAQVGISLKAKDKQSRDVLLQLLGVLEKMKTDIGPHDAVDLESVSSAYVENFALRVFANADNEDRSGRATRYEALCPSKSSFTQTILWPGQQPKSFLLRPISWRF